MFSRQIENHTCSSMDSSIIISVSWTPWRQV